MQATGPTPGVIPYRPDIDGLRAVSVLAVIFFHAGLLPNGYLGVDVFFVISGFLITGIVKAEVDRGVFTFRSFYERRLRRIIPLALVVPTFALVLGIFLMLPDDLENLAQSVVATNFFANNILQAVTTKNYWDVVNEFKPLLHTWSLGVEEQFYLVWPLMLLLAARRVRVLVPLALAVVAVSFLLFLAPVPEHWRFYYLPFRFFELGAGGLVALLAPKVGWRLKWSHWAFLPLLGVLVLGSPLENSLSTSVVVGSAALMMLSSRPEGSWYRLVLENPVSLYIGAISYSLYMWHQPVFAFTRYAYFKELTPGRIAALFGLAGILSALSYRFVETPFRQKRKTSIRVVLAFVIPLFAATTAAGLWLYFNSGIVRDVPELSITRGEGVAGQNANYNSRIYDLDEDFRSDRRHVLVVGNSFARDWANVLLESDFANGIELSYVYASNSGDLSNRDRIVQLAASADVVFWAATDQGRPVWLKDIGVPLYVVGPKNFGESTGIFYNYRGPNYYAQRTLPDQRVRLRSKVLGAAFGDRYIDLIAPLADDEGKVPVFTPEGKFISQDCRHLTRAGASFYARILRSRIAEVLGEQG